MLKGESSVFGIRARCFAMSVLKLVVSVSSIRLDWNYSVCDAPRADAEVIALATNILQALGLKNLELDINSVGNGEDRANYRQALVSYLEPYKDDLDEDSKDRLTRNPLRILDSKDPKTQEIASNAPKITEHLSDTSKKHFDTVLQLLTDLEIRVSD